MDYPLKHLQKNKMTTILMKLKPCKNVTAISISFHNQVLHCLRSTLTWPDWLTLEKSLKLGIERMKYTTVLFQWTAHLNSQAVDQCSTLDMSLIFWYFFYPFKWVFSFMLCSVSTNHGAQYATSYYTMPRNPCLLKLL